MNCNVIKDLLELYADGVVSEDTRELVDEHLQECEACAVKLQKIKGSMTIPARVDVKPLKKIKKKIARRFLVYGAIILPMFAAIMVFGIWGLYEKLVEKRLELPPALAFSAVTIGEIEIVEHWSGSGKSLRINYSTPEKRRHNTAPSIHRVYCDETATYEYHFSVRQFRHVMEEETNELPKSIDLPMYEDNWLLAPGDGGRGYTSQQLKEFRETIDGFADGMSLVRVYYCEMNEWGRPHICDPDKKTLIWEK
jgi:hypothetical protein